MTDHNLRDIECGLMADLVFFAITMAEDFGLEAHQETASDLLKKVSAALDASEDDGRYVFSERLFELAGPEAIIASEGKPFPEKNARRVAAALETCRRDVVMMKAALDVTTLTGREREHFDIARKMIDSGNFIAARRILSPIYDRFTGK